MAVDPHRRYWRANLMVVGILLALWFVAGFLLPIILVEPLNAFRLGGFKLGFWFAQQGSIIAFVLIIIAYVLIMNRLDRKYGVDEKDTP